MRRKRSAGYVEDATPLPCKIRGRRATRPRRPVFSPHAYADVMRDVPKRRHVALVQGDQASVSPLRRPLRSGRAHIRPSPRPACRRGQRPRGSNRSDEDERRAPPDLAPRRGPPRAAGAARRPSTERSRPRLPHSRRRHVAAGVGEVVFFERDRAGRSWCVAHVDADVVPAANVKVGDETVTLEHDLYWSVSRLPTPGQPRHPDRLGRAAAFPARIAARPVTFLDGQLDHRQAAYRSSSKAGWITSRWCRYRRTRPRISSKFATARSRSRPNRAARLRAACQSAELPCRPYRLAILRAVSRSCQADSTRSAMTISHHPSGRCLI
jgi:hypothetical protein